jgi:hypothetical protein
MPDKFQLFGSQTKALAEKKEGEKLGPRTEQRRRGEITGLIGARLSVGDKPGLLSDERLGKSRYWIRGGWQRLAEAGLGKLLVG